MRALEFQRNLGRFAAARVASSLGSGLGAKYGPLRLVDIEPPELPSSQWARVQPLLAGICGSDLATVDGRSSRYFEDLVSFPFVPGHEIVGTLASVPTTSTPVASSRSKKAPAPLVEGERVVIEPVLGCAARSLEPACSACTQGMTGGCERVSFGHLHPGLQTGYCRDTGGGWSSAGLVAHESQLHRVPETLSNNDAVLIEPLACGIHAASSAQLHEGQSVAVIGAGTVGLMVIAGLSWLARRGYAPAPGRLLVGARHSHQRRFALELGADNALSADQLGRAVRRHAKTLSLGDPRRSAGNLAGGADIVIDCVGSASSIAQSLSIVAPRGRVLLVGMPAKAPIDLVSLWHREVTLIGAYAYGAESLQGSAAPIRTFDLAIDASKDLHLGRLVSATYPLERFEEALVHAGSAGRRGSVKIAFDLASDGRAHRETEGGTL